MNQLYNAWPETLAFLLKRSGLSQAQVAARLALTDQTISRWMARKSRPGRGQFADVARVFSCSPRQLGRIYSRMLANHYWPDGEQVERAADAQPRDAGAGRTRTVLDRVRALLALDLERAAPEVRPLLHAHRNTLRNLIYQFCDQSETLVSEFYQLFDLFTRRRAGE